MRNMAAVALAGDNCKKLLLQSGRFSGVAPGHVARQFEYLTLSYYRD